MENVKLASMIDAHRDEAIVLANVTATLMSGMIPVTRGNGVDPTALIHNYMDIAQSVINESTRRVAEKNRY